MCATCLIVVTGEAHPSLLGHNCSDGTVAAGQCLVAIEDYRPLIQRRFVVVYDAQNRIVRACTGVSNIGHTKVGMRLEFLFWTE
jgi:hypothetical protein